MSKATPRPWRVDDEGFIKYGRHSDYLKLQSAWIEDAWINDKEAIANAALIVRAVNSHDALVEACREFARKVEAGEAHSVRSYAQMKAALALAEASDV